MSKRKEFLKSLQKAVEDDKRANGSKSSSKLTTSIFYGSQRRNSNHVRATSSPKRPRSNKKGSNTRASREVRHPSPLRSDTSSPAPSIPANEEASFYDWSKEIEKAANEDVLEPPAQETKTLLGGTNTSSEDRSQKSSPISNRVHGGPALQASPINGHPFNGQNGNASLSTSSDEPAQALHQGCNSLAAGENRLADAMNNNKPLSPKEVEKQVAPVKRNLMSDFSNTLKETSNQSFNSSLSEDLTPRPLTISEDNVNFEDIGGTGDILFMPLDSSLNSDDISLTLNDAGSQLSEVPNVSLEFIDLSESSGSQEKKKRNYTPPEKLTRKRQSNPDNWKKNITKAKLSKGEEYKNASGKLIRARCVQPPCDLSCRMKCFEKIKEEARIEIHEGFYSKHQTREEKWGFISRHVKQKEKESNPDNVTRRKYSRKYSFRVGGEEIPVCKTMSQVAHTLNAGA